MYLLACSTQGPGHTAGGHGTGNVDNFVKSDATARRHTILISLASNLGGIVRCYGILLRKKYSGSRVG